MKFAVVEYSSKTGNIWRHTPERPNYLCDPIKEIDPTSFGCYVSALEGEHIPLTAIIRPTFFKKVVKRLTGSWPQNYDLSYFKSFDALLIVHQISDGHEVTAFTKRLKQTYPNLVILGVPTQPYGILVDHWKDHPKAKADIIEFMNICDHFITIVESTKDAWQQMTSTPVSYVPQPYPVSFATKFWKPLEQKQNVLFVAGNTERDNIKKGQNVARKVQQQLPQFEIHVTKIPDTDLDTTNLEGSNFKIMPFDPWQKYLEYVSSVMLVINTDYTATRGRVQADCAAVGTPSIGADSDGQKDYFPSLPADKNTSEEALVQQCVEILTNTNEYIETVRTAKERLSAYSYEESAKRLRELIDSVKV